MDLLYIKLGMAAFAILLIIGPMAYDWAKRKLKSYRRYKLQIIIRTSTGSIMYRNRYYPTKSIAVIAAWWHGPDPKTSWIESIQTSIQECNG